MDLANIELIVNLPPPNIVNKLHAALGHMQYYKKIIKGYVGITIPLEKLLVKKYGEYIWNEECHKAFDTLKEHLEITPILIFLD